MSASNLTRPSVYQFKLGQLTVTTILEGFAHRQDMHPFVATNASAEEVEALARKHRLPFPAMEHNFVATVVQSENHLVAIDPGFGENAPMPSAGLFASGLESAGYNISDVDIVAISHCHPDHTGNLMTAGKATFPNAEVVMGRQEFEYWNRGENISEMRQPTLALFEKVVSPLAARLRLIEAGESITPEITAVEAFGHSAGHFCFHLESNSIRLLLLNDTVPHYVASFANPEWHFLMDDDPDQAAQSRRRILDMAAADNLTVSGFHIPFPSVGYVERRDQGFEFRPATYQLNLA